jgi:hypothetical protein
MIKAALVYFGLVFGAGFILGPIRVLLLEPQVGARIAELIEAPIMLTAILFASRWISRHWSNLSFKGLLGAGMITVAMILSADLGVGVFLRDMSVQQVFTNRDIVTGSVYYILLAITATAPAVWRSRSR